MKKMMNSWGRELVPFVSKKYAIGETVVFWNRQSIHHEERCVLLRTYQRINGIYKDAVYELKMKDGRIMRTANIQKVS